MFDFIKSLNLSDELKYNDIYNLFKTDSSDLNLQFLSSIQKFKTLDEFLNFYTKQDCKKVLENFNNISLISTKICNENENINNFTSEIDKYLSDLSKIIFLFSLIQKNNELLSNLLINAKKFTKRYHSETTNKYIKEKINNCINDLMSSSQITSQRNYSRRSTKENTINCPNLFIGHNLGRNKQNEINEGEYLLFQCNTPKFEEDEENGNEIEEVYQEQTCFNNNNKSLENIIEDNNENSKKGSKKSIESIASSLSFKHMKFIYDTEENTRGIKKNKTVKIGIDCSEPKNFFTKKSISNKVNDENSLDSLDSDNEFNNKIMEKSKLLAKFLNIINELFKNGKINSNQKLTIKQLVLSDSENIIEKFYEYNKSNKNIKSKYIKKFLIEQIKK